jgi:peptide/nickel transport system permease protein
MAVGLFNTVSVAFIAFLSSFGIGVVTGSMSGFYYKTWIDRVFNWVCAILYSVPFLLIVSGVMSLVEKNLTNAYLVLTAIIWVAPARIVRAGIIRARSEPFVMSERAMGYSEPSILIRTLLPYSIGPSFIFSFKYLPELIGLEAGLSFLGLGIQPPEPGLGKMIFDSLTFVYSAWWYALFPSLLLFVVVLVLNVSLKISSTPDLSS